MLIIVERDKEGDKMSHDRRVRKTQTAIKDALITLLEKKRFEEITIQEISDLADVNRSTFYTHFIDKYDLLDKMENEKIDEIRSFLEVVRMMTN